MMTKIKLKEDIINKMKMVNSIKKITQIKKKLFYFQKNSKKKLIIFLIKKCYLEKNIKIFK
jgi:hypothetical protein